MIECGFEFEGPQKPTRQRLTGTSSSPRATMCRQIARNLRRCNEETLNPIPHCKQPQNTVDFASY
jgi:hypothetical protein